MKDSFNQLPTPEQVDAFIRAAGKGDNAAVRDFADKYPKSLDALNFRTYIRQTALMAAAAGGHKDTVELLLAKGAAVDRKNERGATALAAAANTGKTEIVGLLLKKGASIDIEKENAGWTILMIAGWHFHVDTVRLLVENGAKVGEKDDSGATALDHARKQLNQIIDDPMMTEKVKDDWIEKARQVIEILEKGLEMQNAAPKRPPVKRFRF